MSFYEMGLWLACGSGLISFSNVEHQFVIDQVKTIFASEFLLQILYVVVDKLSYGTGIDIDHVIVMAFVGQFVDGMAVIEVVSVDNTGRFKLREHSVHGG